MPSRQTLLFMKLCVSFSPYSSARNSSILPIFVALGHNSTRIGFLPVFRELVIAVLFLEGCIFAVLCMENFVISCCDVFVVF
jgi:hypothetical protein